MAEGGCGRPGRTTWPRLNPAKQPALLRDLAHNGQPWPAVVGLPFAPYSGFRSQPLRCTSVPAVSRRHRLENRYLGTRT